MPRIHLSDGHPDLLRRRLAQIDADERYLSSVYWRAIRLLVLFTACGLLLTGAGLVSTSPTWGPVLFWCGVIGADIGFAGTLGWAYLRLES